MKLLKLVEFAVFLSLSTIAMYVRADDAIVTVVKKGEQAPHAGLLFSPQASAVLATELATAKETCDIRVENELAVVKENYTFEANKQATRCSADKSDLELRVDSLLKENDILKKNVTKPSERYVWAGAGVLGGIGFTLLTTYVISRATR